jgi:hypothetical protein
MLLPLLLLIAFVVGTALGAATILFLAVAVSRTPPTEGA